MNRNFGLVAFAVGLGVVAWVAIGYVGSHALALLMTLLIGAFYLMGAVELHRFQRATASLRSALATLPERLPVLGDWLATLHPSLRNAVRLRVEGERAGLPGPAITPYLVGLLVLLGMLGTFLGMVVTLNGAVMALESTTDLATIRAALAAPIKGLGLAFGTSVAGVAASAMLGLVSVLCRRERQQVAQLLDARIATSLRDFSRAHQREQMVESLQAQARAVPELVDRMQAMMAQMERHSESLGERLLAGQDRFHQHAQTAYAELASSVDRSLHDSLTESARVAGATIQPVVEATMAGITRETAVFQEKLSGSVGQQLDGLSARFDATVTTVTDLWTGALARHDSSSTALTDGLQQSLGAFNETFAHQATALLAAADERHATSQRDLAAGFAQRTDALLATVQQAHAGLQSDLAGSDQQRLAAWTDSLAALAASLRQQSEAAGAQALAQQQQICQTLEQTAQDMQAQAQGHARDTIAEMSRLIATASEAPRAAAEVVAAMREQLSDSLARDTDMLQERSRIMDTLATLLDAVSRAATEQRGAIDTLVASADTMLHKAGTQFSETMAHESGTMAQVAAQVTASTADVASMGEAFAVAVQQFGDASQTLTDHLQRIEAALTQSTARSDEQLAYYVAQAREIVDLSISSQKQIVEDLQQLTLRRSAQASEVA